MGHAATPAEWQQGKQRVEKGLTFVAAGAGLAHVAALRARLARAEQVRLHLGAAHTMRQSPRLGLRSQRRRRHALLLGREEEGGQGAGVQLWEEDLVPPSALQRHLLVPCRRGARVCTRRQCNAGRERVTAHQLRRL